MYGVHLININETLCSFYEKFNVLNDIKHKGDTLINEKTEAKKRVNLEIKKWQNKLDIIVKNVLEIPLTSQKVIGLKKQVGFL